MAFPCPGCGGAVGERPDRLLLRCPSCGARLHSRPIAASGPNPAFEVEVMDRPETRRRVELEWDERQRRRLQRWLVVSSTVTFALVLLLFLLARLLR